MYHITVVYCLLICLHYVRRYGAAHVEIHRILGDAPVQDNTFGSTILLPIPYKKSHFEWISHLYGIEFWD